MVTVVVGTKGENISRNFPTNVRVSPEESGLPMETIFLCFQIRSLDPGWFSEKSAGKLSDKVLKRIENVVCRCLGM